MRTWYLWAVVTINSFAFLTEVEMRVTTDKHPTHSDAEHWVLIKTFEM